MKRWLLIISMLLFIPLASPAIAYNPLGQACNSATQVNSDAQNSAACQDSTNQVASKKDPVVTTIAKAAKIISLLVGVVSVVLILASGLSLILSSGSSEAVKSAKSRIVAAIVGLVIASFAWLIASFVINKLV